ncbi:retrovirus-related pol polyprotein from transposon TNT 1-94 [Tanacetum coccineum]
MDLCGPMIVESINGKRYVLVIVDDYSCYTLVHFLRSKDEAPEEIKTFLKKITVLLQASVIIVRIDNGTEFKNQVLKEYFDSVGISYQSSSVRTPQQNGFVERRNRTLVEAARTMFIFLVLYYSYGLKRFLLRATLYKTPYELINDRKLDISFLHVFEALYYPKNDCEDIGKLGAKVILAFHWLFCYFLCLQSLQPKDKENNEDDESLRTAPVNQNLHNPNASTTVEESAPTPTNSSSQSLNIPITSQDVDKPSQQHAQDVFENPFAPPFISVVESSSSQYVDPSNMHTFYQPYQHDYQWTKDHPLEQVIGEPSRPV